MSTSTWTQQVLKELTIRDEHEKQDQEYFTAFQQLSSIKLGGDSDVDVRQLITDKETLITKMNGLHLTIERANDKAAGSTKMIKQLEEELAGCRAKISGLVLELNEKNKAIETVNDELLSLNIQNNVLGEKVGVLQKENEVLIERWMKKVKEDVERLNEANEREEIGTEETATE